jgi:preprotein translocase subunit SecB
MTEENQTNVADKAQQAKGQFALQRIYVKDLSFETPNGLNVGKAAQPKVNQDLNTSIARVTDELYEVILHLTVTVELEEGKTAFLIEVKQAGLFLVKGVEGEALKHLLMSQCPQLIFPYAREAIDSTAVRGGFAPLNLPPINFDAIYAQAALEAKKKAEAEGEQSAH